jgi:PhnB protein
VTSGIQISLQLAVQDAPAAAKWYSAALHATQLWSLGGVIGLQIEGTPIILHEETNSGFDSPATIGTTVRIEVFADDPDSFLARAVAGGATGYDIHEHEVPWGVHRQGGFTDPFGHIWLVGDKSPLQHFPPDQF